MDNLATGAAQRIWPVLRAQGLLRRATYHRQGPATVDITTGDMTTPVQSTSLEVYLGTYELHSIDGVHIQMGDQPIYFPKAYLPDPPRMEDAMVIKGVTWMILPEILDTGAGAFWVLHGRKIQGPGATMS